MSSAKVVEGDPDIPLKTYMIPLEEVKVNIEKWRSSIEAEHRSLIVDTRAVEPLSEEAFQTSAKLRWKSVRTIKAYSGRYKTRGVGCGNYQHGDKRTKMDSFSGGIDANGLRLLVRNAALRK